ncbi:gas vesicle protein [Streptomyces sp. NPDC004783]|uniref:gas vesicle protein GvpO n=1 Tax=unclassified Streptomyces TaxID=2593676 RepID=UPI00339E461A
MTNTKNTSESPSSQQTSRKSTQETRESQKSQEQRESRESQEQQGAQSARRPGPMEVLREARAQFAELTGLTAESVSSFGQTEDGWSLEVEVLELERVPDTMSLMASYQVELDPQGQLTGYRRARRYERGRADARGSGR